MKTLIQRLIEGAVVLGLVYLLAGCNMLAGAGRDLTWLGELQPPEQQVEK